MTEEPKPYAILAKDLNPDTQEFTDVELGGEFVSSDWPRDSYPESWIVVRDRPKRIPFAVRLCELLGGHPRAVGVTASRLIEEGYATEYPR